MAIEFFFMVPSPPSMAVWMTFKALEIEFEQKTVNVLTGEHQKPEYLAINARGKVPAIKDGDYVLSESRAISAYLCNRFETGADSTRLYPLDAKTRGIVDRILYISEDSYETIFKDYMNMPGIIFRNEMPNGERILDVHKTLKLYEDLLAENKYIACDHLTIADFFMHSPLMILEFSSFDDYQSYPKTIAWKNKIKELPYFEECHKGLEQLHAAYKNRVK